MSDLDSFLDGSIQNAPRADRNYNPGNVTTPASGPWDGQIGTDGNGFAVFSTPEAGQRAADLNLAAYGKDGQVTPSAIANKWASTSPADERQTKAAAIAKAAGVGVNDKLDLSDPQVRSTVLPAIYSTEGGAAPAAAASPQPQVGPSLDDFIGAAPVKGSSATPAATTTAGGGGKLVDTPTGVLFSDGSPVTSQPLADAWQKFTKTKAYDANAQAGTPGKPYAQAHGIAPVVGATYLGADGETYTPSQADLDAYTAASKQENLGSGDGALFNGALQGFAPEAIGAARYVASGGNPSAYSQGANVADAQLEAYRNAHPVDAALSTGLGSLGTGALGMEGLGAAANAAHVPALLGPTGEFLAGSAGGNDLLGVTSRAANAGVQGAAFGAGSSHLDPDQPLWKQALMGGVTGGLVGTAVPAAAGVGKAIGGAFEPFSASGRDAIVNRLIGKAADADIAPSDLDLRTLVPGSSPTLAQATGNPGIGALERAVRSTPQGATAFGARDAANTGARNALVDSLTGDDVSLDALRGARDASTSAARQAAFANASPTDATGVVSTIDGILQSPAGQRDAVTKVLGDIRSKLVQPVAGTNIAQVESDPAQLYGIRQALTDHLAAQGPKTASDARLASSELMQVKGALDDAIEAGAPGYKDYLKAFSDASGPINEQQLLQSMRLHDMRGNVTLGKSDAAINRITQAQAASGTNPAKSVSDDTMNALTGLRDDLRRESAGSSPGRFIGSNTVQNLASNQMMGEGGIPGALGISMTPHGQLAGAALGLGKLALASKNGAVQDALINRLLDPTGFAGTGQGAASVGSQQWLHNALLHGLVPAGVEGARNYLLPADSR